MNYILFDLAILAVLAIFLWRGYAKGFILTLCGFLAIFVALIGASILSNALAEPVAKTMEPVIAHRIQDALAQAIEETDFISVDGSIVQTPEELPLHEVIQQLTESKLYQNFAASFQAAVDSGAAEITTNAARSIAHFAAVQIARTVIFAVSFFAILIAWFFLSHALDLVAKLPVLNSVNQLAGGAVGLAKGVLLLFIAAWLFKDSFVPPEAVEQTYLLKFFCTVNPLSLFQ